MGNYKNYKKQNTKASETRKTVLELLLEWEKVGGRFDLMLKGVLDKYNYLDSRDKAFMSMLARGCVERRITLDYIIDMYADTNGKDIKPAIRNILRMGLFQVFYMEGIADHAACSEAVLLTQEKGFKGLAPFVNGVMRAVLRDRDNIKWPSLKDDDKSKKIYYSVYYSMPIWIVGILIKQFGAAETKVILESFLTRSGLSVRVNNVSDTETVIKELKEAGIDYSVSEYLPYMINVSGIEGVSRLQSFTDGKVTIQDVSSALVAELSGIKKGDRVLDMCAAPGGKATHFALKAGDEGHVTACDISDDKVWLIEDNISRMNLNNINAVLNDGTVFNKDFEGAFDVVVCDAPCSGLGIMGRKPDIRYNASFEGINELAGLQKQILANAVRYVKTGGTLIFSTCTLTDTENMGGREYILSQPGMKAAAFENIPEALKDESSLKDGYLLLKPGIHKCDGFFISKYTKGD